ncbi:MAG TPA: hypothetical protein PK683_15355, partial [Leptospiraceae bacterium]|nr:hypothetical protein [Leptospiraceae bacterium]
GIQQAFQTQALLGIISGQSMWVFGYNGCFSKATWTERKNHIMVFSVRTQSPIQEEKKVSICKESK